MGIEQFNPNANLEWAFTSQMKQIDPDFDPQQPIELSLDKISDVNFLLHRVLTWLLYDDGQALFYSAVLRDNLPPVRVHEDFDPKVAMRGIGDIKVRLQLEISILRYIEQRFSMRAFFLTDLEQTAAELEKYTGETQSNFIEACDIWEKMKDSVKAATKQRLGATVPDKYDDPVEWENLFV